MKIALLIVISLALCSCVTGKDGRKHFAPGEAAVRTDNQISDWLEANGYPNQRYDPDAFGSY